MTIKKAVVIGGSNGIGLAVSRKLIDRGYSVKILGIHEPDRSVIGESECEYVYFDLRYPNEEYLNSLARDEDINALFISSGIGRFSDFQYFHTAEIEKTFLIDTVSPVKIIRHFYDKILTRGGGILLRSDGFNHRINHYTFRSVIFGGKGRDMQVH